ncbi:MAG: ABC transporter ATP-binding protein [Bacteroidetes bacterium]|nr:ABC transporter ATP-binding protein [Bacteroidota bacterium]
MLTAELQDITKDYFQPAIETATRVLDHISLAIAEDDTIAIMGPSGSGKTTLLNLLGTLDRPTSGKVFRDGISVEQMDEKKLAIVRNRFTGFIFQQHLLLPQLTVLENVLLPVLPVRDKLFKEEAGERALQLIERVGLKNFLYSYPARLSMGECQRAAVVRALINRPKLILADEPTGSLDARNAAMLADLLAELRDNYNYSLVIVTHDPEVARRMKIQYRLLNGKIQVNI